MTICTDTRIDESDLGLDGGAGNAGIPGLLPINGGTGEKAAELLKQRMVADEIAVALFQRIGAAGDEATVVIAALARLLVDTFVLEGGVDDAPACIGFGG